MKAHRLVPVVAMLMTGLAGPQIVHAADIQTVYYLHDVKFDDGSTMNGKFSFDNTTGLIDSVDIGIFQGSIVNGADIGVYMANDTSFFNVSNNELGFVTGYTLSMQFGNDFSQGGTLPIIYGDLNYVYMSPDFFDSYQTDHYVVSGSASTLPAAVPEPATWGYFFAGFGLLGAISRRKRVALV